MTPRLPRITAKEIIRIIIKIGFKLVRSTGSHHIYKNQKGKRVTVPVHSGKILHPKTLQRIIKDAELTTDDLINLLGK